MRSLDQEALQIIQTAFPNTNPTTISEGYKNSIAIMLMAEKSLKERVNTGDTFAYLRTNPKTFFYLVRDLDKAIGSLNSHIRGHFAPPYDQAKQLDPTIYFEPLPKVLALAKDADPEVCETFRQALMVEGMFMQNGERKDELSDDVLSANQWIEGHIRGKTSIARVAAILMHGYDLTVVSMPQYKGKLKIEDTINPLCEALAVAHKDSLLFETLYDPNDLNWYAEDYGMSAQFLEYLGPVMAARA